MSNRKLRELEALRLPRSSPLPDEDSDKTPPPSHHCLTCLVHASTPHPNPKNHQSLPRDEGTNDDEDCDETDHLLGYADDNENNNKLYGSASQASPWQLSGAMDAEIDASQDASCTPVLGEDYEALLMIAHIRTETEDWVLHLGPVDRWAKLFQDQYDNACTGLKDTQEGVDQFLKNVESHVKWGRRILAELRKTPTIFAPVSIVGWTMFLNAGNLYDMLYNRIHLLEACLNILAPQVAVSTDVESSIRKYRSLVDKV